MSAPSKAVFVTGAPLRHITVMSVSGGVGLLSVFFVDFVDLLFISMLGEDALAAAIGYAGTVLFFVTSIGIGLAIGVGALTARALGRDDPEAAKRIAGAAVALILIVGGICAGLLFIFAPQAVSLLGASGAAHDYAVGYLRIVAFGAPFLMLGMAGGAILRAHGDARRAMTTTISAAVVNAVLDPILIFGLDLDLTGAALATVAARVTLAVAAFLPLIRIHDALGACSPRAALPEMGAVFAIAGPAMATNVATPVGNAIVTRTMAEFGTEAVAGYAMVMRLSPLAFCLLFSLSAAVGPIIGQNFGADRHDRVRETFIKALWFAGAYTVAVSALLFMLREPLAGILGAEGDARTLLYLFCGPLSLAFFFNGALFSANAAFNNLDRPLYSTIINWARHTLGTAPFALVGAAYFGAPGVLAGQFLGGAVFAVAGVWLGLKLIDGHAAGDPPPKFRDIPFVRRGAALNPFSDWRP